MAELISVKNVQSNGTAGVSINDMSKGSEKAHANDANTISHTGENGTNGSAHKTNGINGHNTQNGGLKTATTEASPSLEARVPKLYNDSSEGEYWTTKADASVRLRIGDTKHTNQVPMTVNGLLEKTVKEVPNRIALAVKREGKWRHWTYTEYYEEVRTAAKSFIKVSFIVCCDFPHSFCLFLSLQTSDYAFFSHMYIHH